MSSLAAVFKRFKRTITQLIEIETSNERSETKRKK